MLNTLTRTQPWRLTVLLQMLVFFSVLANAQESARVSVIPQPREMSATGTKFPLDRSAHITLADPKSTDDQFAANDFIDDAKQSANVTLNVSRRRGRQTILIGLLNSPSIQAAFKNASISLPASLNEEGYVLNVDANSIVVAGASPTGVFYGLQTLKQLIRGDGPDAYVQGVKIVDWPAMRWRGVSDDISRGPVPTVAYIKRQLRTFAAYKLNMHSFYMEHTFSTKSHPLIGPEGGSLTADEIRELVVYAKSYHIELVPEQQTFGHLHKALKFEKYNSLAETPYGDVLSPQQ